MMDLKTLVERWEAVRTGTRQLIEALPAGREDFRPAEGTMSLKEMLLHVIAAEKTAVDALTMPGPERKWDWTAGLEAKDYDSAGALLALADRQTKATKRYFARLSDANLAETIALPWDAAWTVERLWFEWILHEVHHRGSVITTLRVAGVTPPNLYG